MISSLLAGASALGGWLSSTAGGAAVLGGATSALGGLANTLINNNSASHSAAKSYHYSKLLYDYQMRRSLLDSPSMQIQGLRNAGVNPLVAYGNLGYSGSMPSFNAPMAQGELDTSALGASLASLPTVKSQLATASQQRAINFEKLGLDKLSLQNSTAKVQAEIDNIKQDTVNKMALTPKYRKEVEYINGQIALNNSLRNLHDSEIGLNNARIQDLFSQISLRDWKNPSKIGDNVNGFLDNHPWIGKSWYSTVDWLKRNLSLRQSIEPSSASSNYHRPPLPPMYSPVLETPDFSKRKMKKIRIGNEWYEVAE